MYIGERRGQKKHHLVEFNYILSPASSFTRPISISSWTGSLARIRLQGWNHCWKAKTRARSTKAERATMTGSTKERVHSLSAAWVSSSKAWPSSRMSRCLSQTLSAATIWIFYRNLWKNLIVPVLQSGTRRSKLEMLWTIIIATFSRFASNFFLMCSPGPPLLWSQSL